MCTDNPIIVENTYPTSAIICMQKKAEKIIPTEYNIIEANKLAFNDDIGAEQALLKPRNNMESYHIVLCAVSIINNVPLTELKASSQILCQNTGITAVIIWLKKMMTKKLSKEKSLMIR